MEPNCIPAARNQGGAFTAQQAREHVRRECLQEWLATGLVIRESLNVYRLADAAAEARSRLFRAELIIGRPLIACHQTAAELHGFGVLASPLLHVTTGDARSIKAPPAVLVHQLKIRSPAAQARGCLAVNPADTAVDVADVAAAAAPIDILVVLDAALRAGVGSRSLADAVARARGLRGIVAVRDQLPRASPLAESPMESRTRFRIHEAGLPSPELQIVVPVRGGGWRKLDMGWRAARVGLEFDGQDFHTGDGSLDRDRRRAAELIEAGWTVIHVTAADVFRNPERFTTVLRDLLQRRGC